MESFQDCVLEYKKQMEKGVIQKAYKGIMEYIMQLRTYFKNAYPEYSVPGNIYFGYMDMTYFPLFPEMLKKRKLKIAIVFIHDTCRFEVWLSGNNKQVQRKYWELIKANKWNKYRIVADTKAADSIIEDVLVEDADFRDLDALTKNIERSTSNFINDIEEFLSRHKN